MGEPRYSSFRSGAVVFLSSICAFLIALPFSGEMATSPRAFLLLGALLTGALIGYRRRKSTIFFYFVLVAVPVLGSLLTRAQSGP